MTLANRTSLPVLQGRGQRKEDMHDQTTTIEAFLEAAAAKKPTPGGGSVTALVGALAASMGEMVINYSIGRKDLEPFVEELKPAVESFNKARLLLLQLMQEDQSAYELLSSLRKLPEDSPERREKYSSAVLACIRVPQAICATACAALEVCDRIINFVNPYLLSDLAVCADLSMATVRCAVYNVRVNLPLLTDPSDRRTAEAGISQMLTRAGGIIQQVSPRIWSRHSQIA
jgi:formiminotetrahydrofolate cyclodeaminase